MKKAVYRGASVCKHLMETADVAGDTVTPIANEVTVEDGIDESVFKMKVGEKVMLCDDCHRTYKLKRWQHEMDIKISEAKEDPRLAMVVTHNYMYSYTGSRFDNKDLVLLSKYCGNMTVAKIFQEVIYTVDLNTVEDGKLVFIRSTGVKGTVGNIRVKLVHDTLPENHQFYDINTFGVEEKVKIIRIILPDAKNLLPGDEGFDETLDPTNNMTLEDFFNVTNDLDAEAEQ
jgi:hypothetical protein